MGRCANLTKAGELQLQQGRSQCQARDLCHRVVRLADISVLILLRFHGRKKQAILLCRPDSVVHSIIYDEQKQKSNRCKSD